MKAFLLVFLISLAITQNSYEFKGEIIDAESGEKLAGVNVYRDGTMEGTASNIEGKFLFITTEKSPQVILSYVGYQSKKITLKQNMTIKLKADLYTDAIVVVSATGLSRAQQIIVNTIENYEEEFKSVEDFETKVYSKVFFYFPKIRKDSLKDDSLRAIGKEDEIRTREPWVFESYKRVNWERPDKISQIILKRNQGKAIPAMFNFLGVVNYQNAFKKEFMDHSSPLHDDNFWDFDYSYRGKVLHEGDSSFVIMASRVDTTHIWQYKMLIGDNRYDLKRIEVAQKRTSKETTTFNISPFLRVRNSKNITVMQDYKRLNNVSVPKNYTITRINERGVVRMSELYQDFKLNTAADDIAFSEKQFTISPTVDEISDSLWQDLRPVPLNRLERRAFVASDSLYNTYEPWQRFMFSHGFKIMFFNYYWGKYKLTSLGDLYHFSPVEGHTFGFGLEAPPSEKYRWVFNIAYAEAMEKFVGQASLDFPVYKDWDLRGKFTAYHKKRQLNQLTYYFQTMETFSSLFSHESNFSHLLKRGFDLDINRLVTNELSYGFVYRHQEYIGLENKSEFSFFNQADTYKKNIKVADSREHELGIYLKYDESDFFDLPPFKIKRRKQNAWQLESEITFDINNSNAIKFKRLTASLYKQNDLTRFTQLNFNSDIYYVGKAVSLSNMFFPRTTNFFNRKFEFSLAGFNDYEKGSFDFASLGANLRVRRFLDFIGLRRLGTLSIFGQAYTMENYGFAKIENIDLVKTELDFNVGASIENNLFFIPLRFVWYHNTKFNVNEYKITFGASF